MITNNSFDTQLEGLRRASRRGAAVSLFGFALVLAAMGYASLSLIHLEHERDELQGSIKSLKSRTDGLLQTQRSVLDFLGGLTASGQIRLIDPSVDWSRTEEYLMDMPAGPRKTAALSAILLAWKNLPFSTNNQSLTSGLDSPHFINIVLAEQRVHVEKRQDERLSDAMMRQFKRVDSPLPGDLLFYHGNVGSFVVMYIAPGSSAGNGIAVGTLQTGEEVQVLDTAHINTPVYPYIGCFRVPYPGSESQR
jgi:hypothetical protein